MKTIKDTLIERGYPERQAQITSANLSKLTGMFKNALDIWMENGKETPMTIRDFSISDLMSRFKGMTYPAALLTLEWLERDYSNAKLAIEKGIR